MMAGIGRVRYCNCIFIFIWIVCLVRIIFVMIDDDDLM